MEKVYVVSEDGRLYNYLCNAPKYSEYLDNIEFVNITSVTNIVDKNMIVILDKSNYELDILRLFAKKMYVILCAENGNVDVDIEEDNRVIVIDNEFNIEQIYSALKMMRNYRTMETTLSKSKGSETEVKQAVQTDYLTGLPNRRGMYEYFSWDIKSDTVHCMFLDIDNFKKVNDTYGHKMGDKLLVKVSHMIKERVGNAFLARLSGDEFAIIIEGNVPKENVIAMAESIVNSVDEVHLAVDVSSIISFSIGVMLDQSSKDDLDDILMRCDVAMYQAKKNGKGRYIIFNDIEKQVEYKMSVDRDKYTALSSKQFRIYIQPRINMATMEVDGADAGIYWEHPKDGIRKPDEYIDLLEEDGFIVELENQMFGELCRIMSDWKGTSLENIAVCMRMSKKHMYKKEFVNFLNYNVKKYGLKQENFCIGLTDIDNHPKVKEMINSLKKEGYDIACYKNISSSKMSLLNVNDTMAGEWVLERSVIKELGKDRTSSILAKSIIALARELGIRVVAHDVEEKVEAEYMTKYRCDVATGKYFVEPLTPSEFKPYALNNIISSNKSYIYELEGNLKDQNGENEGFFVGNKQKFVYDDELKKQVVRFNGEKGAAYENTIELPRDLLNTKNYTISMSYKNESVKLWGAVLQIDFENGFASIMPNAWDDVAMFRVKDFIYDDEWNDAIGNRLEEGKWHYLTATYNSKKKESRLYVDGELQGTSENVHIVENPVRMIVGGDVWTGNINGMVGHIVIHDYVVNSNEVMEEYKKYVGNRINGD